MLRLSEQEAQVLLGEKYSGPAPQKKHKYNAHKTIVDGIQFDSQREAEYYCELRLRVAAGEITKFDLQPEFVLQEGYINKDGRKVRAIKYRADFRIYYPDGRIQIVDVKGVRTRTYLNKKKMLLKRYPDMWFTEVT